MDQNTDKIVDIVQKSINVNNDSPIFIIFVNGECKGYVTKENEAKDILEKLYNILEEKTRKEKDSEATGRCKILRENSFAEANPSGKGSFDRIKLSYQSVGIIFEGSVKLLYDIMYRKIPMIN